MRILKHNLEVDFYFGAFHRHIAKEQPWRPVAQKVKLNGVAFNITMSLWKQQWSDLFVCRAGTFLSFTTNVVI